MKIAFRLAMAWILASSACAAPEQDSPPPVAEVGFEQLNLVVLSRDARAWTDCTFTVDPGGYSATHAEVRPGERASIRADNLADPTGKRFDPYRQKPVRFTMTATIDGRPVTWTTNFQYGPR
jgi:hypothetical protein